MKRALILVSVALALGLIGCTRGSDQEIQLGDGVEVVDFSDASKREQYSSALLVARRSTAPAGLLSENDGRSRLVGSYEDPCWYPGYCQDNLQPLYDLANYYFTQKPVTTIGHISFGPRSYLNYFSWQYDYNNQSYPPNWGQSQCRRVQLNLTETTGKTLGRIFLYWNGQGSVPQWDRLGPNNSQLNLSMEILGDEMGEMVFGIGATQGQQKGLSMTLTTSACPVGYNYTHSTYAPYTGGTVTANFTSQVNAVNWTSYNNGTHRPAMAEGVVGSDFEYEALFINR